MGNHTSPWNRPGAEILHTLLGGDPATDTALTTIVEQLDDLARLELSAMVGTALANARSESFERGWREAGGRR